MENKRPSWSSRLAFVLAAIGSAVGLGNVWRFPYIMGQNGGAIFLAVYILVISTICFIPLMNELYIGKITNWFDRIGVAEIQVETRDLPRGCDMLIIGNTTGILEFKAEDLRVDYEPADMAPQGCRCSVAVPLEDERFHPHRGDKVFIWV